jgi:hypothetical protein
MATYYRNTNKHGVSIGSGRQRAGSVFSADGDDAQKWGEVPGVEKASKKDYDDQRSERTANNPSSEKSGEMLARQRITDQRVEHRRLTVSGPLQRVVGDDQAPLGPPTGTLSTKREEAEKDLAHRLAFGPNEAKEKVPEPEEKFTGHAVPKGQLVHNEQQENREVANATAEELNEMDREGSSSEGESAPPQKEENQ